MSLQQLEEEYVVMAGDIVAPEHLVLVEEVVVAGAEDMVACQVMEKQLE